MRFIVLLVAIVAFGWFVWPGPQERAERAERLKREQIEVAQQEEERERKEQADWVKLVDATSTDVFLGLISECKAAITAEEGQITFPNITVDEAERGAMAALEGKSKRIAEGRSVDVEVVDTYLRNYHLRYFELVGMGASDSFSGVKQWFGRYSCWLSGLKYHSFSSSVLLLTP